MCPPCAQIDPYKAESISFGKDGIIKNSLLYTFSRSSCNIGLALCSVAKQQINESSFLFSRSAVYDGKVFLIKCS